MSNAHTGPAMSRRKAQHLSICLDDETYVVETNRTRLDEVHLVHRALPEIDEGAVDTSVDFLGTSVALPIFISSMTGGSDGGYQINKDLAAVAEELRIPVGMGSIRILLRKPDVTEHFQLKRYAPSVPVFANIGGVQLPEVDHDEIFRLIDTLGVDAIAVHLNPGQELVQPGGDRDFRGILDAIERFVRRAPVPVIVKETGFGIPPWEIDALQERGVAAVDIAGAGGTNWSRVESYRQEDDTAAAAATEFDDWGIPTALILASLGRHRAGVFASGGIRNGIDVVKALALGADAVGLALPFVRAVASGGISEAVAYGRQVQYVIRTGMTLMGCTGIRDLRDAPVWIDEALRRDAESLRAACNTA